MSDGLIPRRTLATASESLRGFRAVVLQGARQAGKSTSAEVLAEHQDAAMVTLDREEDLAAARDDPGLFLDALGFPAVIDEVQRAGDPLILAIKQRLPPTPARSVHPHRVGKLSDDFRAVREPCWPHRLDHAVAALAG